MLNGIFDSTNIPVLEKIAAFAERRQEILAGNLANIDTPQYKTRDLPVAEFQAALEKAIHGRQNAAATSVSSSQYRHLGSGESLAELFPDRLFQAVEGPNRNLTFQDGNNRSTEAEVTEMTKNAMLQNFAVEVLNAQMNMLQMVISERV